jgi:hypothetical protein
MQGMTDRYAVQDIAQSLGWMTVFAKSRSRFTTGSSTAAFSKRSRLPKGGSSFMHTLLTRTVRVVTLQRRLAVGPTPVVRPSLYPAPAGGNASLGLDYGRPFVGG